MNDHPAAPAAPQAAAPANNPTTNNTTGVPATTATTNTGGVPVANTTDSATNNATATIPIPAHAIQHPTYLAPLSSQAQQAVSTRGTPATLNLDDIFGDCFFTPEGDAVFLSETQQNAPGTTTSNATSSGDAVNTTTAPVNNNAVMTTDNQMLVVPSGETTAQTMMASKPVNPTNISNNNTTTNQFMPVTVAGGIVTTGLDQPNARATVMGPAASGVQPPPKIATITKPAQQRHHLQYAVSAVTTPTPASSAAAAAGKKKNGAGGGLSARERKMSDQQKTERRERNREHAKRSRIRKKFLLESLQQSVSLLKEENDKLRTSIRTHLGDAQADELLTKENLANAAADATNSNNSNPLLSSDQASNEGPSSLIASNSKDANKVLDDPDFSFIKALQTAQQNFVVTDPSLPDNPIVYATQGFLNLTGYSLDQVLGRNCRFLQGPETDPKAVEKIRRSIEEGTDMSVCLLNYRVDGTTFWNQFFIAALRDAAGNITNYVGVQCKVSDQYAANVCKKQEEEDAKNEETAAAGGGGGDAEGKTVADDGMEFVDS